MDLQGFEQRQEQEATPETEDPRTEDPRRQLPEDRLQKVWGGTPIDAKTAWTLIDAWGVDRFRASAAHRRAMHEAERELRMEPVRSAFVKAMTKRS
jgi:hypothetical protein